MDLFDDNEVDCTFISASLQIASAVVIQTLKLKSLFKTLANSVLNLRVLIVSGKSSELSIQINEKLRAAHFDTLLFSDIEEVNTICDICIVDVDEVDNPTNTTSLFNNLKCTIESKNIRLLSDGYVYCVVNCMMPTIDHSNDLRIQCGYEFVDVICIDNDNSHYVVIYRKCRVFINNYIPTPSDYGVHQYKARQEALDREWSNINDITISCSYYERITGILSKIHHQQAVRAMNDYGVCIIKDVFDPDFVRKYGDDACADFSETIERIKAQAGVDITALLNGRQEVQQDACTSPVLVNNFYELSMRERGRCDMRLTPRLKALYSAYGHKDIPDVLPFHNIYYHPGIY